MLGPRWVFVFSWILSATLCGSFVLTGLICDAPAVPSEMEDELVFQEFKRSYLKGIMGAGDDDDEEGNVSGGDDMAPKEK